MEVRVYSVAQMYSEMMILMEMRGHEQGSRNGPVLSLLEPLTVTVLEPTHRVLVDKHRMCNPFFHVMEFVWMMAGRNDVESIRPYNSRFKEYADDDGKVHGAYGHRWRKYWGEDQLLQVRDLLAGDRGSRRAVLGMWDPGEDLGTDHNDIPCNTQIYFRVLTNTLDMTVCNRSNDVIWGMCGANAVHMTLLHELMARDLGLETGYYRVFTNNAHVYTEVPGMEDMLKTRYPTILCGEPYPVLREGETLEMFLYECENMMGIRSYMPTCSWLKNVAIPMRNIYLSKRRFGTGDILCPHWRQAAIFWLEHKRGLQQT